MRPVTVSVSDASGGVKYSDWIRLDDFAPSGYSIQCDVTGTVNYTVQTTLDDPNSATNPVAVNSVTWVDSSDTNLVGATATKQSYLTFTPAFIRVKLNSGTGSVSTTVLQSSNGPV